MVSAENETFGLCISNLSSNWFRIGGISIRTFFWGYLIIPVLWVCSNVFVYQVMTKILFVRLVIVQLTIAPATTYTLDQFTEAKAPPAPIYDPIIGQGDYPQPSYGSTGSTSKPTPTLDRSDSMVEPSPIVDPVQREDRLLGALFGKSVKEQITSSYFWWVVSICRVVRVSRLGWSHLHNLIGHC